LIVAQTTTANDLAKDPPLTARGLVVAILEEAEGGYSVIALNLPGAASQGETKEEALANIRDAAIGCLEAYEASGEEVPWTEVSQEDIPTGAKLHAVNL
jgi:predicted RNase H-like HicB family nuclease